MSTPTGLDSGHDHHGDHRSRRRARSGHGPPVRHRRLLRRPHRAQPRTLDALADDLGQAGVTAAGFAADIRDPAALTAALDQVAATFGPIEVLQYSPLPAKDFMLPVLETTAADLVGPVEFSIYGSAIAVHQVLPGMRTLGRGTVLFVNGGSAVTPGPKVTGTSVAFAGQAAYAQLLHQTLGGEGILVSQLIIPGAIVAGDPHKDPDILAGHLWDLHTKRDRFRYTVGS